MQLLIKKTLPFFIIFLFFITGVTTLSAENPVIYESFDVVHEETATIYRYGPEGISSISVKVIVKKGEDLEGALVDLCAERAEHDQEIQQYLTSSSSAEINKTQISFVKSRGRGMHYDSKIRIQVNRIFKKFPNFPPYKRTIKIPTVHAKYRFDPKAYSIIRPFSGGNETIIKGPHMVDVTGFLGYTTWIGMIAKRGFILRCGFAGYGLVTIS